jgi:uncharacterized membrane protein
MVPMFFRESDFEKRKRERETTFKLGLFYWNPYDKRVFVPDRFNLGLGEINFAHPRVWYFLLILSILIIIGIVLERYLL